MKCQKEEEEEEWPSQVQGERFQKSTTIITLFK